MWSKYSAAWDVDFAELPQVYSRTTGCAGLVHAVQGPELDTEQDNDVLLTPIGLQHSFAKPRNKQEAAMAAHGLLHILNALHKVSCAFFKAPQCTGVQQS